MLFYGPSNRDCGLRVRCEGQDKGRVEAASQATCKGSEEIRSGITFNPTGTLARGFRQQASNLFVCLTMNGFTLIPTRNRKGKAGVPATPVFIDMFRLFFTYSVSMFTYRMPVLTRSSSTARFATEISQVRKARCPTPGSSRNVRSAERSVSNR